MERIRQSHTRAKDHSKLESYRVIKGFAFLPDEQITPVYRNERVMAVIIKYLCKYFRDGNKREERLFLDDATPIMEYQCSFNGTDGTMKLSRKGITDCHMELEPYDDCLIYCEESDYPFSVLFEDAVEFMKWNKEAFASGQNDPAKELPYQYIKVRKGCE